jgi:SAM-dependent methyltransferase
MPDKDVASFRKIGVDLVRRLAIDAGMEPAHSVVDIGSGIGRVAIPLTQYLSERGSYHGLEIIRRAVDWCNEHISAHYENFRFTHLDIRNPHYNPRGRLILRKAAMPIEADSADIVFLASVFTHIGEDEATVYLQKIASMLKPGGRLWSTWFLLDEETKDLVRRGSTGFKRQNTQLTGAVTHEFRADHPGAAVGFDERFVLDTMDDAGLRPTLVKKGRWCRRRSVSDGYQDVIIAERST